ncbi:putative colanic acid biosynthesis acetyltransferase [Pokkaliibacter plantistimulans]|uniref:Colanic acid biosynthesis acetyltransferase n=1 Tax=Proteobacteria bacterium 228 TaxID=2083153 RepID=A0A2S5KJZ7_9PROT|nr:putative colanic acid biosynthesis acetyltransferase [Pokkaliibacter plantistimulans]PPC74955.1 putative colanic acid biosynthesis acetyltransferase [Pokkaliibacter plantistimulans]
MTLQKKKNLQDQSFNISNKITRIIWGVVYYSLFRFSPTPFFRWRQKILRIFGSSILDTSRVYPSAKIWLPANLTMGSHSTLGPNVNCYNQGHITIEDYVIVSQGVSLCASTHDYNDPLHPLLLKPIHIKNHVWVCAEAFIGPGVVLEDGCVIGARSVAFKNCNSWSVYAGNPAVKLKDRVIFTSKES